ncbi:hypothetical protein EV426DRAFT_509386, partial [Tirmania nivea]
PRRMWDLESNRVLRMRLRLPGRPSGRYLTSWADDMEAVDTSINGYQWPVPLPRNTYKPRRCAEYVWLDVLCLLQQPHNPSLELLKQYEWKLDVPTIGNVYRAAERVVRYFNGLGIAF